jgi:serine/threonine protein kinase
LQPERIGRYVILRSLGRGAMGVVYLARDPQIERELALKTIRFDEAEKSFSADEAKARFLKEAKISGRLQHPHIVTVFDVGEDQGMLYLAMELVQGGSFSQRLSDTAGFPVRERVRVVAEVAEALAHAHERGVLHRDIKPANILLTPALSAKVTDFGIGKLLSGDTELTSTGQMVGSPAYMSPEQIKGDKLDARTDIFSLGVVLYQALTLRKPFPADTLTTLVYQILHEDPADPAAVAGDLPEGLGTIVRKCLAKDRANRYLDAGELADDLRAALGFGAVASTASFGDVRAKNGLSPNASTAPTAALPTAAPGPPGGAPPPPTTPMPVPDSESPTITTGRRMGEAAAKADAKKAPPPAGKKGLSAGVLGAAALAAVLAVVGAVLVTRKGGAPSGESGGPATAPTAAAASAPSSVTAAPATPAPATPAPATAGPAIAVVETPVAATAAPTASAASPSTAPRKARAKPTAAAEPAAASAKPAAPAGKRADLTVTIRRFLKINVSPIQARVYLDGNYIGISDDWDDAGGGSLLTFNLEGQHRLRICYPEHRDLTVDVVVRSTAADDKVTIEQELVKGTPDGPTGPEGKLHRPDYKTIGAVLFNVTPPDAIVSVNGREYGPASKWIKDEMLFRDMAVYQVSLAAPGYQPKTVRLLVAPTAGEIRTTIKERLKKE